MISNAAGYPGTIEQRNYVKAKEQIAIFPGIMDKYNKQVNNAALLLK